MISTVVEILATVADTLMLVWFIPKLIGVSLKNRSWTLLIPMLQLSIQLFFDWFMPGFNLLPMIIMFFLVFTFAFALSPKTVSWNVLAALAYISLMMINSNFLFSVFSFFIENMNEIMQGSDSNVRILHILVAKLSLYLCYKSLLLLFKKEKNIEVINTIMTLIITVVTVIALSAIIKIVAVIDIGIIDVPILIIVCALIIINIILYLFIYQIQKLQKNRYELMLMNERITLEAKQAEDANNIWNNIRKVRHDIKNHLSVIKGHLEQGDTNACSSYIESIQQTVESMGTLIRSGNSVFDYLINSKLSNLEGVQILISGYVGDFNDISDVDMVCILGNILDNAIEAVKNVSGSKRIELYFSKIKKNRLILCKNSVDFPVLDKNKKLKSTKKDKMLHGFGHQIIESTVEKYGGFVGYFDENGMFVVQVSIPEPIETK